VLPYRSATQSGITSIAYHFETPLVATDVGGLKEEVGERGTGIVVDKAEPGAIAGGIRRYFESNSREKFTEGIREAKRTGTWEMFADRLVEFSRGL
jgi:glycosyltransferase involved in cell wall biosynthesis